MTAYLGAQETRRKLGLRRPFGLRDLLLAGMVGGLAMLALGALAGGRSFQSGTPPAGPSAVRIPLPASAPQQAEAARRFHAFSLAAQLTTDEQRATAAALASVRDSWEAAIAYFEALEESDGGPASPIGLLSAEHAREVETLVRGAARDRLASLGESRLALLDRYLAPLSSFVAVATP